MDQRAYSSALELTIAAIPILRALVVKIRRQDRHLADQLRRAATSIALNLAEADGNREGTRRLRLETAHGSVGETKVALQLAVAWGYLTHSEVEHALTTIDRVGAMTWRRLQRR